MPTKGETYTSPGIKGNSQKGNRAVSLRHHVVSALPYCWGRDTHLRGAHNSGTLQLGSEMGGKASDLGELLTLDVLRVNVPAPSPACGT